ncbi:unnamed protein product [Heligmosomoides polygyrus]|uniref:Integrase catalytic domain-containing protein n=1 Tax=Heligmosomoides polygyrus TaxID=6339 RepID=A0A183GJP2_HELPZ|nr:unnamed protein product [Heligmosomoides polygyrus]
MGPLPSKRVIRTRPFENIGIDYFAPITTKQGADFRKIYGIILICITTRLLHIELVHEMSTEMVLTSLRRFFAHRGVPATITSDNGPSFLLGN